MDLRYSTLVCLLITTNIDVNEICILVSLAFLDYIFFGVVHKNVNALQRGCYALFSFFSSKGQLHEHLWEGSRFFSFFFIENQIYGKLVLIHIVLGYNK